MEIAALGHAPHLEWILRRLKKQGIETLPEPPPSPFLTEGWVGLAAPGLLIDLSGAPIGIMRHRAECAHSSPSSYIELIAPWHPVGEQLGYMLFVGADVESTQLAKPILDALAPMPDAWLRCGPPGAAAFVYGLYFKLWHAYMSAFPQRDDTQSVELPDWVKVLQRHQELAQELLISAQNYLDGLPEEERKLDETSLLMEFALPPLLQPHYARVLAGVIVLTLGQHPLATQALEQFWRNHHPD